MQTASKIEAAPAQEETKRAVEKTRRSEEETKRFRLRAFTYPPVLAAGIIAMAIRPEAAMWIAIAIVGVLGGIEGAQLVDKILSRDKE